VPSPHNDDAVAQRRTPAHSPPQDDTKQRTQHLVDCFFFPFSNNFLESLKCVADDNQDFLNPEPLNGNCGQNKNVENSPM